VVPDFLRGHIPEERANHTYVPRLEFLAVDEPAWEGILRHGVYHERRGLGVDESVMWGDYFYVEALDRVLESTRDGRS
jgi:hypothetical protein